MTELYIYLNDELHCIVRDDENAAKCIKTLLDIHSDRVMKIEKKEVGYENS